MVALLLLGACVNVIEVHWHRPAEIELDSTDIVWLSRQGVPAELAGSALAGATRTAGRIGPSIAAGPPPCTADVVVVLEQAVAMHLGDQRTVSSRWTVWACPGPERVDDSTLDYELPAAVASDAALAAAVGAVAADRLTDNEGTATRRLYAYGHPAIADGMRRARVADWSGAVSSWRSAMVSPRPGVRARAAFNLAVAAEFTGRTQEARHWASDAAALLDVPRTRRYVDVLDPEEDAED
ncbi:MAG: hypothetical protein ACI8PZ_002584 [Myxococcota bacterium]